MISNVSMKNFKSLKNISVSVVNLNVLAGLNGSGKSSFLQMLLLLRQSFKKDLKRHVGLIIRGGELIDLGKGKDIFYQFAGKDEKIEAELRDSNENSYHWKFDYNPVKNILPIAEYKLKEKYINELSLFNENFQYLNAEHIPPQISYQKSEFEVVQNRNIGTKGEYSVHYLAEFGLNEKIKEKQLLHPKAFSESLIHQVDAWIADICPGTKLVVEEMKGIDALRLAIKFETKTGYTDEFKPINVGFGISYVIPVVLAILKAKKGDILFLENPESHLHPKGQSLIGKLMAYASQVGVQIFAETHSDHIINGVRVAVKENKILKKNVKILFFERNTLNDEQQTIINEILIDKNGELSVYPKDFFDEWNEQLMRLI